MNNNKPNTRIKTYYALADQKNRLVGTAWNITQSTGKSNDFYITPYFSNPNSPEELRALYVSLHLPGERHTSSRFHFQMKQKELKKLKQRGYTSGTDLDIGTKHQFLGEETSSGALLLTRLTWSNLLQFPKYANFALNCANMPQPKEPDSGAALRTQLPLNTYWQLDIYLTKDKPFTTPGAAWGLANSTNGHPAQKVFKVHGNGQDYYLNTVSKRVDALRQPLPKSLYCPPAPVDQTTRITRIRFKDGLFPWVHETITTRAFRDTIASNPSFSKG